VRTCRKACRLIQQRVLRAVRNQIPRRRRELHRSHTAAGSSAPARCPACLVGQTPPLSLPFLTPFRRLYQSQLDTVKLTWHYVPPNLFSYLLQPLSRRQVIRTEHFTLTCSLIEQYRVILPEYISAKPIMT